MACIWVGFMKEDGPFVNKLTWQDLFIEEQHFLFS
jgi:hypothetical protein